MKINKIAMFSMLLGAMTFTSCSESIDITTVNENPYVTSENVLAFITDKYGATKVDSLTFSDSNATDFYINLNKISAANADYTLVYDESALAEYNAANGTDYKALPQDLVTISGNATVAAGQNKSAAVSVAYKSAENLEMGVYAIPLTVKSDAKSKELGNFVLLVKDITKMPKCHKANGIQIVSCMEVNDTNPLNNLCFTLKSTGQPIIDQVILFSGNINYSPDTGEVYNFNNENVQHLLDYKEKYLKPLQEKGMKVILGILGNHDRSGVSNLTEVGAKAFAQELKAVLDAYELDGVFFDDEYSNYGDYPGFEPFASSANAARLMYWTKQAIGEKLVETYVWSTTASLPSVNGVQPGEFVDYGLHDYGGSYDLSSNYPGMPKMHMGLYSQEISQGRLASQASLRQMRADGYGVNMIFAMDPIRRYNNSLNAMKNIAIALFDDECVYDGNPYSKDW